MMTYEVCRVSEAIKSLVKPRDMQRYSNIRIFVLLCNTRDKKCLLDYVLIKIKCVLQIYCTCKT